MRKVPFINVSGYWIRHPMLWRPVHWSTALGAGYIICEASVGSHTWTVRLNDSPDEPLHTLLIDGNEVMHFDDWPWFWRRPPLPEKAYD